MTNKPTPLEPPLQYESYYQLDLYCDHANDAHDYNEFPHTYIGETFKELFARAIRAGWKLNRKRETATCPKCNKELKS